MANVSSMKKVIDSLKAAFNIPRTPLTILPPQLLVVGANLRPGLSARNIASRVIARQTEAGAPAGDIFSENNNIMESMMVVMAEEIISALQLEAKIEVVIPPGVQVTTSGVGNLGGPIISLGATTNIASGAGVIR
jgi:hypothetical protein|tara:strand:+ start:3274 stop:3678 length:405 start_codon:yes stop_codon:yes gene_type:complete